MRTGLIISGIGHGALILWLLFGGFFSRAPEEPPVDVAEVSVITEEQFAALSQPEPAPQPAPPAPAPRPEPAPAPEPAPEPAPAPEPQPAPEPPAPPAEIVAPPSPAVEESAPANIDRVAPEAAPEPAPDVETAPDATPPTQPTEAAETPTEPTPETAPEAATTQIVTEATETQDLTQFAPASAPRPPARPERPARPEPAVEPAPEPPADAIDNAVADALAGLDEAAPESPAVPTGSPLTTGERDAFRIAVGNCWNVGSLSTDALGTTVVVAMTMREDGRPDVGTIRLVSHSGGSEASARQAFETARRAIIRCGASGYNLPPDKYDQWREIEMTFNPANMRVK